MDKTLDYLTLIKDNYGKHYRDRTQEIQTIEHLKDGKWKVLFIKDITPHIYGSQAILHLPLTSSEYRQTDYHGKTFIRRDTYTNYIRLIPENGECLTIHKDELKPQYNARYNYLISCAIRPNSISKSLARISSTHSTALKYYLSGYNKIRISCHEKHIYPFGITHTQKNAIEHCLQNNITIIKTRLSEETSQFILNLIANLISDRKTLAILSNDTDSLNTIITAIRTISPEYVRLTNLPEEHLKRQTEKRIDSKMLRNLKKEAISEYPDIIKRLRLQNKLKTAMHDLQMLENDLVRLIKTDKYKEKDMQAYAAKILHCVQNKNIGIFKKVNQKLRLLSIKIQYPAQFKTIAQFYIEIKQKIEILDKEIEHYNQLLKQIPDISASFIQISKQLLNNSISVYAKKRKITICTIEQMPVLTEKDCIYDYIIIQDAQNVSIPEGAACMARTKNIVLIENGAKKALNTASMYATPQNNLVPSCYDASRHNIISSVLQVLNKKLATVMLNEY